MLFSRFFLSSGADELFLFITFQPGSSSPDDVSLTFSFDSRLIQTRRSRSLAFSPSVVFPLSKVDFAAIRKLSKVNITWKAVTFAIDFFLTSFDPSSRCPFGFLLSSLPDFPSLRLLLFSLLSCVLPSTLPQWLAQNRQDCLFLDLLHHGSSNPASHCSSVLPCRLRTSSPQPFRR